MPTSRPREIARLASHCDRPDAALEPDPAWLDVGARKVILDPIIRGKRVRFDLRNAVGYLVQQRGEAIGPRQVGVL